MSTPNTEAEIRSRIDSFLSELSALVRNAALESVQEALSGDAPRRRGPGRPRTIAKRRSGQPKRLAIRFARGKRTSAQVDAIADRVLSQIRANPGQRLEELGVTLKTPTKVLKLPVAKLLATKRLKTKGQKRGTKYFAR